MENNPYEAELNREVYQQKLKELSTMYEEIEREHGPEEDLAKLKKLQDYYSSALEFTETICVGNEMIF